MKDDGAWIPNRTDVDWIDEAATPPHPVLVEMERFARPGHIPIVDRDSGRVLSALAAGRRRIAEVGTAIGYSTLWMALGQPDGGTIVTIDPNTRRTDRAREWWRAAGVAGRITQVTAEALEAFATADPRVDGPFDLAFVDALKPEYSAYVEQLVPRLAPGALLVADNVLWSGRLSGARPSDPDDVDTQALREFDRSMLRDPRFNATILPVGDGLLVAGYRG